MRRDRLSAASRWPSLESAANLAILVAATAVFVAVVDRVGRTPPRNERNERNELVEMSSVPVFTPNWQEVTKDGLSVGNTNAAIQVAVFTDLECPFCAKFHTEALRNVRSHRGAALNVVVVHAPLEMHRFAKQSAVALECAADQGRADAFLDEVYHKQDSIGLRPWPEYAASAGVDDSIAFRKCLTQNSRPRIDAGIAWARKLNIRATPTVWINGWSLPGGAVDETTLSHAIDSVAANRPPAAWRSP